MVLEVVRINADWSRLTAHLHRCSDTVTLSWDEFGRVVGSVPASAVNHYPQWWHGDRPNTRAWRAAGFEVDAVRPGEWVRFRRVRPLAASSEPVAAAQAETPNDDDGGRRRGFFRRRAIIRRGERLPVAQTPAAGRGIELLKRVDPSECLVVLPCSAAKRTGGVPPAGDDVNWPTSLIAARSSVLATAGPLGGAVLPAWQRYEGHLYRAAASIMPELAATGRLVILSGGYGLVEGTEPIRYYDRQMRPQDWPHGLLETVLAQRAADSGLNVVAFVAQTTGYQRVLASTNWRLTPGREVLLVSIDGVRGGATTLVPRRLGEALVTWWRGDAAFPEGLTVRLLAAGGDAGG